MERSFALVVVVAGMAWGQSGGAGALLDGGVDAVEASVKVRDLEDSSFDCVAGDPTACEEAAVAAEQADRLGYAESLRARAAELRRDVAPPSGPVRVVAPPADLPEPEVELAPQGVHLVDRTDSGIKRFTFGLLGGLGGAALGSVIGLGLGVLVGFASIFVLGPFGIAAGVVGGPLFGASYGSGLAATAVASSFAGRKLSASAGIIGGTLGVALGVAVSFGINSVLQTVSPTPLTPGLAARLVMPILLLAGLGGALGAQFAEPERIKLSVIRDGRVTF